MSKWEMVKLNDVCALITDGTHQTPQYAEQGFMFLSSKNVTTGKIDWEDIKYIPEGLHNQLYARIAPHIGDVLLAKNGTTGVAAVVDRDYVFDIYVSLALLRPKDLILSEYLLHAINNPITKRKFNRELKGIGVPNLHLKNIRETTIPLPSLETQKQIAKTLDTAGELLAMRKQQLAELDNLIKSTFYDMFGDPVTNEKGWDRKLWGEVFNTTTGKLDANAMCEDGLYPFFTCSKEVYRINDFAFDCQALLLAGNNATANFDVKYYNGKFNAYQRTYVITLKCSKNEYFLFQYLLEQKLKQLQSSSKGTNTKYLTMGIIGRMDFIVPPIELQNKFADIVSKIEEQKSLVKKAINETQYLFDSLMSECFE